MFDDIGDKIKTLAKVFCWIGIGASVIGGFVVMCTENPAEYDTYLIFPGLLIMVFGSLASWLSSLTLYGFGQLIENSDILVRQGIIRSKKSESKNENTTKTIETIPSNTNTPKTTQNNEPQPVPVVKNTKPITKTKPNTSAAPYWCGNCGYEGPYDDNCPNCNSSIKKYKVKN